MGAILQAQRTTVGTGRAVAWLPQIINSVAFLCLHLLGYQHSSDITEILNTDLVIAYVFYGTVAKTFLGRALRLKKCLAIELLKEGNNCIVVVLMCISYSLIFGCYVKNEG